MSGPRTPEGIITAQIRAVLNILRVPHFKHYSSMGSAPGVPDLIGTLPGGRALFIEVKVPGKKPRPDQAEFLENMRAAGAVAFYATSAGEAVWHLQDAGHEPAKRLKIG